ncbi:MAG: hypothetical protein LBB41_08080 [Prevotellaceae bacterium]|jgi:hypothetical protein|nr:hypothetical protein [Prevotellaceae bacterium]
MKILKNIFFYIIGIGLVAFGTRGAVKSIVSDTQSPSADAQKTSHSPFETINTDKNSNGTSQPAATNETTIETATPENATATQ